MSDVMTNERGRRRARVAFLLGLLFGSTNCAELKPAQKDAVVGEIGVQDQANTQRPAKSADDSPSNITEIDFDAESYLDNICGSGIRPSPFQTFSSNNFIYDSPMPVVVAGEFLEIRSWDARLARTIYEEVPFTIFRKITITVQTKDYWPAYNFQEQKAAYGVSDFPFNPERQLPHKRAMGADFLLLALSSVGSYDKLEVGFSSNFISSVNVLKSGYAEPAGLDYLDPKLKEARRKRTDATGTDFVRHDNVFRKLAELTDEASIQSDLTIADRGEFVVLRSKGKQAIYVAISIEGDRVGIKICEGN